MAVLLYDHGCRLCTGLAVQVERHSDIRILPLEKAQGVLSRVYPQGVPDTFFLVEGSMVYAGRKAAWRAARTLGWRSLLVLIWLAYFLVEGYL